MALQIETFSALRGGNSFYKAVTHPEAAAKLPALRTRLRAARALAVYDPLGFAAGLDAIHGAGFAAASGMGEPGGLAGLDGLAGLGALARAGVFVQAATEIGESRLGRPARLVSELKESGADLVLVAAFDAERLIDQIGDLLPAGAEVVSLDAIRLDDAQLADRRTYLNPLNFATNFAFFRDRAGSHTRLVTANYWGGYGAGNAHLALTLFAGDGRVLARWTQALGAANAAVEIDSREVRARFGLPEFEGQLFLHVVGAAGHDVVKYALDTEDGDGPSLSCTHDANAWPAEFYAGLPAPRADEQVLFWVQNSLPIEIPADGIGLGRMGSDDFVAIGRTIPPFATVPVDVAALLPDLGWPEQIEIAAGKYVVRPRYEIQRGPRRRIAHPNVERTDLKPDPRLAELAGHLGKGFILPAPILPSAEFASIALPTPMARSQTALPIKALFFDAAGTAVGEHRFGRLGRRDSVAIQVDEILGARMPASGHMELVYDFEAGPEADGWLHALFRYELRRSGHTAETSFGSHIFNTAVTYKDEPQSYSGRPPGLTTRLFLRVGAAPLDTLCHLVYPASTPWRAHSATDLVLHDRHGGEVARAALAIPCGGSHFWRVSGAFDRQALDAAAGGYVVIRDTTCRLFGYHGLIGVEADGGIGRFSLDHMFGF